MYIDRQMEKREREREREREKVRKIVMKKQKDTQNVWMVILI